jgi:hypothetical protein
MTFRELASLISDMTEQQLDHDVTFFLISKKQFRKPELVLCEKGSITEQAETRLVTEGHFYLSY